MQSVVYVSHMGSDLTVVNAARISLGTSSQTLSDKDIKLIHYLAAHQHTSPFEHCALTALVECPLFIAAQWMRHRTFAFNQVSRRYTSEELKFWQPTAAGVWRKQAASNRQASEGELSPEVSNSATALLETIYESAQATYETLLAMGVSREQARAALPQGLMTKFYATANLNNWAKFIKLRNHDGAQQEIQDIAWCCEALLETHFPVSTAALLGGGKL